MTSSTETTTKRLSPTTATPVLSFPLCCYGLNTHTLARRRGGTGAGVGVGVSQPYPRHFLSYSLISILVILCWLPDFIGALKDVSVTIPQAVKRGSNAMLTCNYDMENDTLYSVKWYKGRREFYRYTPKENPAMKVFLTQSGLNVERNLSNQSHVVLLAVPLNISGKFTCEISVEAPSFQTAMVSGEMEVVELPEEQASVTGIQPRYRIGDLVDGNCSIKYSKPAANLTWTINGIVVPPHHIKTYQIEKYEETNLESVMSTIHFMVTTQHFIKGQMRLKCTASIFDIFKEEIESIIEEDRPRIMASGRSYDAHSYPHDNPDGYEDHNESYLTYFSGPKSSASLTARPPLSVEFQQFHKFLLQHLPPTLSLWRNIKIRICSMLTTFIIDIERYYGKITQNDMTTYCTELLQQYQQQLQQQLIKLITVMAILLGIYQHKHGCHMHAMALAILPRGKHTMANTHHQGQRSELGNYNRELMKEEKQKGISLASLASLGSYEDMQQQQQRIKPLPYVVCEKLEEKRCKRAKNDNSNDRKVISNDCQQFKSANQNVVINESAPFCRPSSFVLARRVTQAATTSITFQNCQHNNMSQALECIATMKNPRFASLPSVCCNNSLASGGANTRTRIMCANDSFPLCENAFNMTKSNNANYMSKDQILLMTSATIFNSSCNEATNTNTASLRLRYITLQKARNWLTSLSKPFALAFLSLLCCCTSSTWKSSKGLTRFALSNNCLMAFIADLLVHQC